MRINVLLHSLLHACTQRVLPLADRGTPKFDLPAKRTSGLQLSTCNTHGTVHIYTVNKVANHTQFMVTI